MSDSLAIRVRSKVHLTVYEDDVLFSLAPLGMSSSGWVWKALIHSAQLSEARRLQKPEVGAVKKALESLSRNIRWRQLGNLALEKLQVDDVVEMFALLEEDIDLEATLGRHSKHSRSLRTRKLLLVYLDAQLSPVADKTRKLFRSRLRVDRRADHRVLISDQVIDGDGELLPPVGALSHTNIADLRRKTEEVLNRPLEMILTAARKTLSQNDAKEHRLSTLKSEEFDRELAGAICKHTAEHPGALMNSRLVDNAPVRELVKAYLNAFEVLTEEGERPLKIHISRCVEMTQFLTGQTGMKKAEGGELFRYALFDFRTLLACFLILQCHTKWNAASVLELRKDWISGRKAPFSIRSFKTRTNSHTPIVHVERSDVDVVKALELLVSRLELMQRYGWVAADESRLWINARFARTGSGVKIYVGWNDELRSFRSDHGLPHFTFEQIRVQTLTAISVKAGGLAAKEAAGHASLATTSSYIDQLVAHRFSSAVNLEFQRRIEAEIERAANVSTDQLNLLRPIGDGASCIDPTTPPIDAYLDHGACDAKHCHSGAGCPNRAIVVNAQTVEEALRMSDYYRANWKRLAEGNYEAFLHWHVPAIAFNFGLVGVLERGPHARLVRQIKIEITAGRPNG